MSRKLTLEETEHSCDGSSNWVWNFEKTLQNIYFSRVELEKIFSWNRNRVFVKPMYFKIISKYFPLYWADFALVQLSWFIFDVVTNLIVQPFFNTGFGVSDIIGTEYLNSYCSVISMWLLIHISPIFHFYSPWNGIKLKFFATISGDVEM